MKMSKYKLNRSKKKSINSKYKFNSSKKKSINSKYKFNRSKKKLINSKYKFNSSKKKSINSKYKLKKSLIGGTEPFLWLSPDTFPQTLNQLFVTFKEEFFEYFSVNKNNWAENQLDENAEKTIESDVSTDKIIANAIYKKFDKEYYCSPSKYIVEISQLFNLIRNIYPERKLLTWKDYTDNRIDHKYHIFRKYVINTLIIYIIIIVFNCKDISKERPPPFEIYNKDVCILNSRQVSTDITTPIKITFEMVGSETETSDYDVTIYSNPPDQRISLISQYFNYCFTVGNFGESRLNESSSPTSSAELFDTNLYTHNVYFFTDTDTETKIEAMTHLTRYLILIHSDSESVSQSDSPRGKNKYFLNPVSDAELLGNEKIFANVLLLEHFSNAGFKINGVSHSSTANISKEEPIDIVTKIDQVEEIVNTLSGYSFDLKNIGEETKICLGGTEIKMTNPVCAIGKTAAAKKSGSSVVVTDDHLHLIHDLKQSFEQIAVESQTKMMEILSKISDTSQQNDALLHEDSMLNTRKRYVGAMRASLYYADETYHTFSAYFHVIHCIQAFSEVAVSKLLEPPYIGNFIEMCKISAIENYAFMFHYHDKPQDIFKKKTAKYLARISHALDLITKLQNLQNPQNSETTKESIIQEMKSINMVQNAMGSYKEIIDTYKYGKTSTETATINVSNIYENKDLGNAVLQLKKLYNYLSEKFNLFNVTESPQPESPQPNHEEISKYLIVEPT